MKAKLDCTLKIIEKNISRIIDITSNFIASL